MQLSSSSSCVVADGDPVKVRRENLPQGHSARLCLRLFGKACVYVGGLAIVALAAVLVIWIAIQLLR